MQSTPIAFWHRLSAITTYPFRGSALISLLILSVLLGITGLILYLPGFMRLVLWGLVWLAVFRYAFEILIQTAHGVMDAPETLGHTSKYTSLKFFLLTIVYGVIFYFIQKISDVRIFALVNLTVVFSYPAAITALAIKDSLLGALNPLTLSSIVQRMGGSYFGALGLLLVIQISAGFAVNLLARAEMVLLDEFIGSSIAIWSIFASFHLLGYLVYQCHDALGFSPAAHQEKPKLHTRDSLLKENIRDLVNEGQVDQALLTLEDAMQNHAVSVAVFHIRNNILFI